MNRRDFGKGLAGALSAFVVTPEKKAELDAFITDVVKPADQDAYVACLAVSGYELKRFANNPFDDTVERIMNDEIMRAKGRILERLANE